METKLDKVINQKFLAFHRRAFLVRNNILTGSCYKLF